MVEARRVHPVQQPHLPELRQRVRLDRAVVILELGESRLALELAPRLNAEIISMDSMALYRGMDIGTAKPTRAERDSVRHHLIDVLMPWEKSSVAWWLEQARECVADVERRGKQVLFVGGTPLYLKALLFGIFDGPPADEPIRRRLAQEAAEKGSESLHRRLAEIDPATAGRLHPNDLRRLIRALEVLELTGRPISSWQEQWEIVSPASRAGPTSPPASESSTSSKLLPAAAPQILCLALPRPELYDRINRRVIAMFEAGLVEEVRALRRLERPMSPEARQALGYMETAKYLEGRVTLEETIARVQMRTRQFAKRQITWFRHLPFCSSATTELTQTLWHSKMKS